MKHHFSVLRLAAACSALALLPFSQATAQSYEDIGNLDLNGIQALANAFGLPSAVYVPTHGVDAHRMTYTMPFLGEEITVSGAVFEPQGLTPECEAPVVVYMHGTVFERDDVPSFLNGEGQIGYLISALGFTVLMPDYVGLGIDDQHLHPYVHAESEAAAGIQMIDGLFNVGSPAVHGHDADQIFLSGYSQGGHGAMALHREMEQNWPEYNIMASAPQSGPYDISGTQFPWTFADESYSNPSYLAYVALAWQSVYGNLYGDLGDWFQEPYASQLPGFLNGEMSSAEINAVLPALTEDFAQPGLFEELLDPAGAFMAAASDNDVYDWAPAATTRLYYCTEDEQVFYENALVAETWMNNLGANDVTAVDLGAFNHGTCAGFAIFGAALWFRDLATFCVPSAVDEWARNSHLAWPNPAADQLHLSDNLAGQTWRARTHLGQTYASGTRTTIDVSDWPNGMYIVEWPLERRSGQIKIFVEH